MFKSIGNIFEKKKNYLSRSQDKSGNIKKELDLFLKDHLGESLTKGLAVEYNAKDNSLIITANSKTLANELVFMLGDINEHLKTRGSSVTRILIR